MKMLRYKDYYGSVDISLEDGCLFGKLEFIDPLVTFEGQNVEELQAAFHEAVDDYIATCEQLGRKPQKPYSGSFNVRVGQELHAEAVRCARLRDLSLNELVKQALEREIAASESAAQNELATLVASEALTQPQWLLAPEPENVEMRRGHLCYKYSDNVTMLDDWKRASA